MEALITSVNERVAPCPKSSLILSLVPRPLFKEDKQRLERCRGPGPRWPVSLQGQDYRKNGGHYGTASFKVMFP